MIKVPFLEHTAVGIEITDELIRWVEVDRSGKKWTLKGFDEVAHNGSEASLISKLEALKESVESDAYHIAVVIPELLFEVIIEELPYFEEAEEIDKWLDSKSKELTAGKENVLIQSHLIDIGEDSKRCLFQVIDQEKRDLYLAVLHKAGLYPEVISTGIFESGYSQIFNPEFIEGYSAVLEIINNEYQLTVFKNGLIFNFYSLVAPESDSMEYLWTQAESCLLSEESKQDTNSDGMLVYTSISQAALRVQDTGSGRELNSLSPLQRKKGFDALEGAYSLSTGILVKFFFQGIDSFNVISEEAKVDAVQEHDKKETLRLGVLLFVPLIIFGLLTYALSKVVDYQLVESNQVMATIGDKIELVNKERQKLIQMKDSFVEAKNLISDRESFAYLFQLIAETIPEQVWVEDLNVRLGANNGKEMVLKGEATNERAVTRFLSSLESRNEVESVSLLLSERIEPEDREYVSQILKFELLIYTTSN